MAGRRQPTGTSDARSKLLTLRPAAKVAADDGYPPVSFDDEPLALVTMDENCEITCPARTFKGKKREARWLTLTYEIMAAPGKQIRRSKALFPRSGRSG